ncbi:MAG TPA: hypothetical protein DEB39_10330 [Planctomycetaceae bacterium]|nr:hypothetical protein [Planctomycetaceae bacterium]
MCRRSSRQTGQQSERYWIRQYGQVRSFLLDMVLGWLVPRRSSAECVKGIFQNGVPFIVRDHDADYEDRDRGYSRHSRLGGDRSEVIRN